MECVKPWENHGKHYQPQLVTLVTAGFLNHARSKHVVFVACIDAMFRPMSNLETVLIQIDRSSCDQQCVFFEELVTACDEKNWFIVEVFFGEKVENPVMLGFVHKS